MRSRRPLTTTLALTLVLGALGAPVAFGSPHTDALVGPERSEQASPRAGATIVRVNDHSGFDWADAGIGAAGGFALSVLGAGLVLLVSEHRAHRTHPST
jgi:hypothetical protein